MQWIMDDKPIPDVEPSLELEGFVYLITYTDGTKYIGKKNFFANTKLPALQSGEQRPNSTRIGKNKDGKRVYFDIVRKPTKWRSYEGSTKNSDSKQIQSKEILITATSKRELTYLEVKYMFLYNVLEDANYLNDNILGKFYRDNLV